MKVASTKLTNPEWEAMQVLCNSKGVTIAEYLRQLIREDAEGPKESEMQETNQKPSPLFQLLVQKKSNSKVDSDVVDVEDRGFSPSLSSSSTLQYQVDLLKQKLATYAQALHETTGELAQVKKELDKNKESIHSEKQQMRCMSSDELARYCPGSS